MIRSFITVTCAFVTTLAAAAALHPVSPPVFAERGYPGPETYKATVLAGYLGSCGGSVTDKNGIPSKCPRTHKPECDNKGSCWCTKDSSCGG